MKLLTLQVALATAVVAVLLWLALISDSGAAVVPLTQQTADNAAAAVYVDTLNVFAGSDDEFTSYEADPCEVGRSGRHAYCDATLIGPVDCDITVRVASSRRGRVLASIDFLVCDGDSVVDP